MLVDLLRAAHAGPSAVVTVVVAGLGIAADVPPGRLSLLLVAVLAGQVAIGWTNDLADVDRDRAGGRIDKPLVDGDDRLRQVVRTATGIALVVTVVASLALGVVAGVFHLVAVAAGLAYDLRLKATAWSPLPYALAFGLLPAFTVAARPDGAGAAWWALAAGACFGVGVHLANVVPDLDADAAAHVRGLPQRLGRRVSLAVAPVVLVGGCALALWGGGIDGAARAGAIVLLASLVVAVVVAGRVKADEAAYRLVLLLGLATVGALVASGSAIVA